MTSRQIRQHLAQAAPGPARFSIIHQLDHQGDIDAIAARIDSPRAVALKTPAGFWIETDPQHLRKGD